MKIMNGSNTQKILRSKRMDIVFPAGVSEHPDIPVIRKYLDIHPELTKYVEKPKPKVVPKKKKTKGKIKGDVKKEVDKETENSFDKGE